MYTFLEAELPLGKSTRLGRIDDEASGPGCVQELDKIRTAAPDLAELSKNAGPETLQLLAIDTPSKTVRLKIEDRLGSHTARSSAATENQIFFLKADTSFSRRCFE
jgi:hypothetical protein